VNVSVSSSGTSFLVPNIKQVAKGKTLLGIVFFVRVFRMAKHPNISVLVIVNII